MIDRDSTDLAKTAARRCTEHLAGQFPEFDWNHEVVTRPRGERIELDPLDLLKLGCQEKIDAGWDFAMVVTTQDLRSRKRPFVVGVPSSALETAAISTARLQEDVDHAERLAIAGQYMFGQLLGLEASGAGAMMPPRRGAERTLEPFPEDVRREIKRRLHDVADTRLEEGPTSPRYRAFFYLRTLAADLRGILADVAGYRPWYQPFRLPTLTGSSFLSMLLLFLGEEAWKLGSGAAPWLLGAAAALAILAAALFLYHGQNLSEVSRRNILREQLVRTRWVVFLCLLVGMIALWILLFAVSWGITLVLPREVVGAWVTNPPGGALAFARFAMFTATLGTLAGGLGGNLEDQDDFAATFFFDEEA